MKKEIVTFNERNCWICGKNIEKESRTMHHCIPTTLSPKKNVVVPLCDACHAKLNTVDISTLVTYINRVHNDLGDITGHVVRIYDRVKNLEK